MRIPKFLIFNFFTKAFLRQAEKAPFLNRRLISVSIDFMLILSMFFPIFILIMPLEFLLYKHNNDPITSNSIIDIVSTIPFSVLTFVLINKDFFNARSVAKRIQGYQIVDSKSNLQANEIQCMIRNITIIIWPVEIFILLISPNRRLGDIIASTKLIDTDKTDPETIIFEMNQHNENNHTKLIWASIGFVVLFDIYSKVFTLI